MVLFPAGQLVPQPLARRAKLPAQLPVNATLQREGATYSWLYTQIFNLLGWAPCPLSTTPSEPSTVSAALQLPAASSCRHLWRCNTVARRAIAHVTGTACACSHASMSIVMLLNS